MTGWSGAGAGSDQVVCRKKQAIQLSRATATTPSRAKRCSCPADIFHRHEKFATILEIPPTM